MNRDEQSELLTIDHDLRKAQAFLRLFDQFDPKMQIATAKVLVEIALAELEGREMSTKDIEKAVGMQSGTTTRNIYYWSTGHKQMTGGWELINVTMDAEDRRKRVLTLTAKGRAFIDKIKRVMATGNP